ncbi:MAG: Uma2 family endonuclease [Armatimonadetes bacterium]|nr:Uma2 family endonuclease [Armatimonadota bacterium]
MSAPILSGFDLDNPEHFFEFCRVNAVWRIERNAQGEVVVRMPTGAESGNRNFELIMQLGNWVKRDGTGRGFDSSTGFDLPNGAMRSPDASWVSKARLAALTAEQKKRFLPLAPDFAAELRSETDSLTLLQEKMEEYIACGVRLALLIDPTQSKVHVYRPGASPQVLNNPTAVDCSPELPSFLLDTIALFTSEL